MGLHLPVLVACAMVAFSLCTTSSPSPSMPFPTSPSPSTPSPPPSVQPPQTPSPSLFPTPTPPHPSRAPGELLALHQRTIDTAIAMAIHENPMRIDTLIGLRWLQDIRPRDDVALALDAGYRQMEETYRNTSLDPFLRMANGSHPAPAELCSPALDAVWECPLLESLYCDRRPPPPGLLQDIVNVSLAGGGTVFGGYASTHALLAARFLEERGCLDRAAVSRTVDSIAGRVAGQARSVWEALQAPASLRDRLQGTDLFAEEVLFLMLAGRCDRVQPWWMESLAADLESRVPYMGASPDYSLAPPHTVLQESLAILYYERCLAGEARG